MFYSMKTMFALVGVLLLGACGSSEPKSNGVSTQKSGPVVIMPAVGEPQANIDTLRLGRLKAGEKVETGYFLKNTAPSPLVIVNSVTGCGCTSLDFSREPIVANDSIYVTLNYDSKGKYGHQILDIDLISADNRISKTILMVEVVD